MDLLLLGLSNIWLHKLRSLLTALGIIFGVAAVITMVAIGEGNKRKALEQIQQLGASNIIVRSVKPPKSGTADSGGEQSYLLDYGLRRRDVRRITETVRHVRRLVPLKRVGSDVSHLRSQAPALVFGTTEELMAVTSLQVARGRYITDLDRMNVANVAVIGDAVAQRLFPLEDPLGNWLRVDDQLFTVIGVLRPVGGAGEGGSMATLARDLNLDIHIPLETAIARFGDIGVRRSSGAMEAEKVELTELYVEVESQDHVISVARQIELLLDKEHAGSQDIQTVVPLALLEEAERTQRMFNALMIAIASISLLVGGIGIMNIMLASVTERTREIGVRRALGATREHIVSQFLVETTALAGAGGLIGVMMGISAAATLRLLHAYLPAIERPEVTLWSVIVSFVVASGVGIVFGLYPAILASRQDPIVALRHD